MQQKSQGTNWQQQNQKQHSKQNKQKNFETRKMFRVLEMPELCAETK